MYNSRFALRLVVNFLTMYWLTYIRCQYENELKRVMSTKNALPKPLTSKQKQFLKGLAHSLKPVVQLGANGLTEGVLAEIDLALNHHELIKVKIPTDDRDEKKLIVSAIGRETGAVELQLIGHTLVLFRQGEEKKIHIPKN